MYDICIFWYELMQCMNVCIFKTQVSHVPLCKTMCLGSGRNALPILDHKCYFSELSVTFILCRVQMIGPVKSRQVGKEKTSCYFMVNSWWSSWKLLIGFAHKKIVFFWSPLNHSVWICWFLLLLDVYIFIFFICSMFILCSKNDIRNTLCFFLSVTNPCLFIFFLSKLLLTFYSNFF